MVRRFAQYCSASDPRARAITDLLPYQSQCPEPYIYRDEDIGLLLRWHGNCHRGPVCDRILMPRYSAGTLPPVCAPMKPCDWIETMSISSMAY